MDDKFMFTLNYEKNQTFCRLELLVEKFGYHNKGFSKVPKDFNSKNEKNAHTTLGTNFPPTLGSAHNKLINFYHESSNQQIKLVS